MRREPDNDRPDAPVCRLSYWQGYVTGCYYADNGDASTALLCSPRFRTWTWRHGNKAPHGGAAARAALESLTRELRARGWRVVGSDVAIHVPEALSTETVLSALRRIGADDGATAAEVGQEVFGDRAPLVQNLPLRIGAQLRRLQLQGKVERRENGGTAKWFLSTARVSSR